MGWYWWHIALATQVLIQKELELMEKENKNKVKVWQQRDFKNLDDSVELGTRNIKVALRRLRKFIRQSNDEELDLDDTIKSTAKNAGLLDIKMVPETNAVKVLFF